MSLISNFESTHNQSEYANYVDGKRKAVGEYSLIHPKPFVPIEGFEYKRVEIKVEGNQPSTFDGEKITYSIIPQPDMDIFYTNYIEFDIGKTASTTSQNLYIARLINKVQVNVNGKEMQTFDGHDCELFYSIAHNDARNDLLKDITGMEGINQTRYATTGSVQTYRLYVPIGLNMLKYSIQDKDMVGIPIGNDLISPTNKIQIKIEFNSDSAYNTDNGTSVATFPKIHVFMEGVKLHNKDRNELKDLIKSGKYETLGMITQYISKTLSSSSDDSTYTEVNLDNVVIDFSQVYYRWSSSDDSSAYNVTANMTAFADAGTGSVYIKETALQLGTEQFARVYDPYSTASDAFMKHNKNMLLWHFQYDTLDNEKLGVLPLNTLKTMVRGGNLFKVNNKNGLRFVLKYKASASMYLQLYFVQPIVWKFDNNNKITFVA